MARPKKETESIVIIVLLFDSQILNIQLLKLQPEQTNMSLAAYVRTQF